jgi:hypothetical protein
MFITAILNRMTGAASWLLRSQSCQHMYEAGASAKTFEKTHAQAQKHSRTGCDFRPGALAVGEKYGKK